MSDVQALQAALAQAQRELRQTQVELDGQRARHAREQMALQRALEEARQEAARLRARIQKVEAAR